MNKQDYILNLRRHLCSLSHDDINDAIAYVEEYFNEAGLENEEKIIEDLGTPYQYAQAIIKEHKDKFQQTNQSTQDSNNNAVKKPWYKNPIVIILLICSLPITLPLLLIIPILLFTFFIIGLTLLFTLVTIVLSLIITAVCIFVGSFKLFAIGEIATLTLLGFLCLSSGSILIIGCALYIFIKKCIPYISVFLKKAILKVKGAIHHAKNKI